MFWYMNVRFAAPIVVLDPVSKKLLGGGATVVVLNPVSKKLLGGGATVVVLNPVSRKLLGGGATVSECVVELSVGMDSCRW